jgi:hypothetical protein
MVSSATALGEWLNGVRETGMAQQHSLRDDEARQIAEETAVIDHLVQIFPFDQTARIAVPYILCSESVFNRIRSSGNGAK